ncbi:glutaminase [Sulfurospirillum sp. 1612]|uniref:glutaminase n=1 Tax=Sulfurospirillum sp. 1612 TaxID=3094835 RepID=UPI002F923155
MDYEAILKEIQEEIKPYLEQGKVADYIPALGRVNPNQFAMSLQLFDGTTFGVGDVDTKFSIQSISKVFTFTLALDLYEKTLHERVGIEPSGNPFNSLVQLEYEKGIPRNPFINAGAIVVTDMLVSGYHDKTFERIVDFIRNVSDNRALSHDKEVADSEAAYGYRNMSLINMMKSFGNIQNDIADVMAVYFQQCSISMSAHELSRAMLFLANHGVDPITQKRYISASQAKKLSSLMLTCGHYDASGDFAFKVGLPGKSGVGGGIVAIVPNLMSLCVWSPRLNARGNSLAGTKALELFTTKTELSIF